MTRARAVLTCAVRGHRWGVRTPAGYLAPRCICARCGTPHSAPLTPRELALGLITLGCIGAIVVLAVLTIGGLP